MALRLPDLIRKLFRFGVSVVETLVMVGRGCADDQVIVDVTRDRSGSGIKQLAGALFKNQLTPYP